MEFSDLPSEIRSRLLARAANHESTSAVDMFNEIPENLRDSPSEISAWLDTHEWSHVFPSSQGGTEAVWETTFGNPNQVRGDNPMTLHEQLQIAERNIIDSQSIDARYSDDISAARFDSEASAAIPDWSASLDQALIGAGLAGAAGYAVAFSFTVARSLIKHREQLVKSREFRKRFLVNVLKQAHKQGLRGGALSFFVSFICIAFPPFQFLLVTGAIVGLGRLGLELLASVVDHVDPSRTSFASLLFDLTRYAFNCAAMVLANLWAALNCMVDWVLEGLSKLAGCLLKMGGKVFSAINSLMDWLLGVPSIVTAY